MSNVSALVAGLGSIGRRHARNLLACGVTRIVGFDPDESRRQAFEKETGQTSTNDYAAALADKPSLVVVASPNRFHVAQSLAAARAGCHLLIEKPVGCDLSEVGELEREVTARGLFAHVGSNWKFHPAFQAIKAAVDDGTVGRVFGAQVLAGQWLPDWHPWEDYRQMYAARSDLGGGIVLDAHEFDILLWLFGPLRKAVGFVSNSHILEIDTEDQGACCLAFESGVMATLQVDYLQREYRRRYHISGDGGILEWDFQKGMNLFDAATKTWRGVDTHLADINDMYIRQTEHVLRGIKGEEPPVTPISQAAAVLSLQLQLRADHV